MKVIRHKVFTESTVYPIWSWNAHARRERKRESIRQRAEEFINEIGVDNVVSVTEHAPTLGPFSVVVWYREIINTDELVVRASDDKYSA
jgi:alpha-D-ribose 1-methylphosphonate 5-triphosphate diphosphatase PhnM